MPFFQGLTAEAHFRSRAGQEPELFTLSYFAKIRKSGLTLKRAGFGGGGGGIGGIQETGTSIDRRS